MTKSQKIKINSIRQACKIGDKCFNFIIPFLKEGVSEKEIVRLINYFIRKKSEGTAFRTIVAFGKNTAEVHHQIPTEKKLQKGDFIMLDFGVRINGYPSDMTRTLFYKKATVKQKKMYETVLNAQKKAIDQLFFLKNRNLSIKAFDIDKIARNYILSKEFTPMPHSLGHGIGRKVHSGLRISPKSKTSLTQGKIFSIEPAIYIKGFGGVRIEDLVVLHKDRVEILTKSPKKLTIL
ncbi:MAG: M24 family metallopeptidase [Patescibacteria group bacterium]|nr:M24 family metallopeptidase [Patescibacteria group bacterium]